jgi:hypothetical protein
MKFICLTGMLMNIILSGNLFFSGKIYCQNDEEVIISNLNITDRLLDEALMEIENKLTVLGKENLYSVKIVGANASGNYLKQKFRQFFNTYKMIYENGFDAVNSIDSVDYEISIREAVITPRYNRIFTSGFLGTRKVEREIILSFKTEIKDLQTNEVVFEKSFLKRFKDNFDLDKQLFIEDRRYDFTRSELPDEGFLNKIIIPAAVIIASAVAIILFFTIRSK